MATIAPYQPARMRDAEARFYLILACAMALTLVAGFSLQLAFGRSSFAAPVTVHVHAVLFMGWIGFYVIQNYLAASGKVPCIAGSDGLRCLGCWRCSRRELRQR